MSTYTNNNLSFFANNNNGSAVNDLTALREAVKNLEVSGTTLTMPKEGSAIEATVFAKAAVAMKALLNHAQSSEFKEMYAQSLQDYTNKTGIATKALFESVTHEKLSDVINKTPSVSLAA